MPEFMRGLKLPTKTPNTLKSGNRGFMGFLRGSAKPANPPVQDALGILNDPRNRTGGGTPPQPPYLNAEWMKLAAFKIPPLESMASTISKIMFWGGQRTANIDLAPPPYPTATELEFPGKTTGPEHEQTVVSAARIIQYLLARFNPLRGLTPRRLEQDMEQWQLGFLRWLSLDWSAIRLKDDQIIAVEAKRIFAVSRLGYEVVPMDDSPEAEQHKQALEAFYDKLTCTHVIDQNAQGGVNLMIRQMMQAIGAKWSVHEIVWRTFTDENGVKRYSANLRFVPMWFFENRTGQLRYLPYELALDGIPLDAGGWLIMCADGLMMPSCIAYMYKQLALRSWVAFCEKFGIPYIHGMTTAGFNSLEWNQMLTALQGLGSNGLMLTNEGAKVNFVSPPATSNNPQESLVDRMDRALARVWRGADLSTMSRAGSGTGALPQIQNEDELAEADSLLVTEACNFYIDRYVCNYLFGVDSPKANFRVIPPPNIDTAKQIAIDEFLMSVGVQLGKKDALYRYGRRAVDVDDAGDPTEEILTPPMQPGMDGGDGGEEGQIGKGLEDKGEGGALTIGNSARIRLANRVRSACIREVTITQAKHLAPLARRIKVMRQINDAQNREAEAALIKKDLPTVFKSVSGRTDELVTALQEIVEEALAV